MDWEKRIENSESLIPVGPLFPDQANDALDVFSNLRMVDATGSPLMGDACLPWVMDIVATLFGSYDESTGRRLIKNYFLMVSKKNGKSTIAAGIMLTALVLNTRPSGEFIILSPTKEASDNAYKPIRDMIRAEPELAARFHEQEHIRTITDRLNNATLKVVAADSTTVTGKKAIGVFIDELHEFGKKSKAAGMLTEATGGLASRPEGFVFYCTTQSNEPPAGVFRAKLKYARDVRDGKVKDKMFLPIIYEFPQWMIDRNMHRDLRNAYVTNPNWGVSVDQEVIEQKYQEAASEGEEATLDFLAKHLNVEIGMNLRSDRWAGADYWESRGQSLTLNELLDRSEVVTLGVDGGGLDDLLGAAAIGREKDTGRWLHWGKAWAHPSVLERRKEIAPRLLDFEKDGDLVIVEDIGDDVRELAEIFKMIYDTGKLPEKFAIGLDQIGISFEEPFAEAELPTELLASISQGYRLGGTIKTVERKLAEGSFIHGNRPMMAWAVSNARVEQRANSILITKQASGTAKIDPLMALLDAAQLMALNPVATGLSVYESRGIRFI
ncbi:terminase large subunit [Advenella mandrilli]|uniref:terminase large subunit n=1 Tax=Advenella mandrilli TaxID=2800330 RepID=UPI002E3083A1|nr:terminase large subunit [Advenella mandrilli]